MKKILDVKLGTVFRHLTMLLVVVYMLMPLCAMAGYYAPGVAIADYEITMVLSAALLISFLTRSTFQKCMYPLLLTLVAHVLFFFSPDVLVGLGKQFQENERGLAEFLAIAMMLTALFDWIGVLYPEEFKRAGAAAVQKRDANTGQQT